MTHAPAVLAAAALSLAASGAAAQSPAFAAFAAVCGATAADFPAVKAAADARGWRTADAVADTMPGVAVADRLSRAGKAADAAIILTAWRGTAKAGVKISVCTLHVAKAMFPEARNDAADWLAMAPQESDAKKAIFRFTDAAGAHHALAGAAEYDAAAAAGGMEILTVTSDAKGAVIDLLKINK